MESTEVQENISYILYVYKTHTPPFHVIVSEALQEQYKHMRKTEDILKSNDFLSQEAYSLSLKCTKPLVVG